MKRLACCALLVAAGCSSENTTPADSGTPDTSTQDTGTSDTGPTDSGKPDVDSGDAGCPASWTIVPVVDTGIAVPLDAGDGLLMHAFGTGTQNYVCASTSNDAGTTYAWTLTGPIADLNDCMMTKIGTHFASDAGATRPEWMTLAGGYVIAKKNSAFTPDGGSGAVPWLLLQETERGGTGPLSKTSWIQRLFTTGGNASGTCDANALNMTQAVSYTADYYFYGQ
jgi:hypothetical protein